VGGYFDINDWIDRPNLLAEPINSRHWLGHHNFDLFFCGSSGANVDLRKGEDDAWKSGFVGAGPMAYPPMPWRPVKPMRDACGNGEVDGCVVLG
jgi:hypothetical protein